MKRIRGTFVCLIHKKYWTGLINCWKSSDTDNMAFRRFHQVISRGLHGSFSIGDYIYLFPSGSYTILSIESEKRPVILSRTIM